MLVDQAWLLTPEKVLAELKVDADQGLSSTEANLRLRLYGPNALAPPEPTPLWRLVLNQFKETLVLILLASAFISFVLAFFEDSEHRATAFIEPVVILLILILNATVGVVQETNAEKAIEKLKEFEATNAKVFRDGALIDTSPVDLVPGDIVEVGSGDKVPADCRLIQFRSSVVGVDESMLTGESENVHKQLEAVEAKGMLVNQDKRNMLFSGTLVVRGSARAVVVRTGAGTEIGAVQHSLAEVEAPRTPLQEKLDEFSEVLSKIIGVICVLVWVINIGHFTDPEHGGWLRGAIYYFKIAVALAVAAIPEGLPAVVTTCLALGTMKMAKKHAIVRSLPSVETLGCATVICSDKTGTLTTNQMSAQRVCVPHATSGSTVQLRSFEVSGSSFQPFGEITDSLTHQVVRLPAVEVPALAEVSRVCTLCNEAALKYTPALPAAEGSYSKVGTATEAALLVLGEKLGVSDEAACRRMLASGKDALLTPAERVCAASSFWRSRQTIQQYLEFRRDRKSMSVIVRDAAGTHSLLCKGAPESILPRCTTTLVETGVAELTAEGQASIQAQADAWAAQGLRVLALAKIEVMSPQALGTAAADDTHFASIESRMTFVGLVGMLDPPRPEVRDAIATCMQAGIRVIVITGDNPRTAEAICRRIGIFDEHENLEDDTSSIVPSSDSVALQVGQRYKKSFTGAEFSALSESAQSECVRRARLFSRVEPTHKLRLVELLQAQTGAQNVVAMTGDGVNDAAALQRSDIGIAMGSGTAVAREASKMVLQDDNFATIVMAVAEGRAIYANTRQFIRYLISSNIGEVVCIFATAALGMPEALIPVQLLWVNLVTDGLPATALGFNPPDADSMSQPPRGRSDRIVDTWTLIRYLVIGFYIGAGTVAGFVWYYMYYALGPQVTWQQLTHFHACAGSSTMFEGVDCSVFQARGEHWPHASTVALSVLVVIEMFNALNALSENQSILSVPPSTNKWVLAAIALSMALHFLILYVPFLQTIFAVAPLSTAEWWAVVLISFPVILVDEVLKFASRRVCAPIALLRRRRQMHNGDDDEPQIPLSAVEYSWSNIRSRLFQRSQRFGSVSAGGSAYKPLSTVELSSSDSGGNTSQPEVVRRR